jgi:cellulose synthase/poly-beta-1,6-N-acetylglucosamine synthase-like glycosyltransferase
MALSQAVERHTAQILLSKGQKIVFIAMALAVIGILAAYPRQALVGLITATTVFYVAFVGLKLAMHVASLRYTPPAIAPAMIDDPDLPTYTVLVPLYKEAKMLPSLIKALDALEYPREKLQILILLEPDDELSIARARSMELPERYKIIVAPDRIQRGKPSAMNLGLSEATGERLVVFDAEDRPDTDQLLIAVAAFRAAPPDVACVQAMLYFWDYDSTVVARFYDAEYTVHFRRVLPGLASFGLVTPLGGTSNHFRIEVLREIAYRPEQLPKGAEGVGGWDAYNVTEDAELAAAMARRGYRVMMIDSHTREEATVSWKVASGQRLRWNKGYLMTGLVYLRQPWRTARQMGFLKWACFTLLMVGTPLSYWLNPIFWTLTIAYFATRSTFIESLFPPPLFYSGVMLSIVGNALLFYQLIGACLLRERYTSVKFMLLTPVWWGFTSWPAYRVIWNLLLKSKRHFWNLTQHGHDLKKEQELKATDEVA